MLRTAAKSAHALVSGDSCGKLSILSQLSRWIDSPKVPAMNFVIALIPYRFVLMLLVSYADITWKKHERRQISLFACATGASALNQCIMCAERVIGKLR